MKHFLHPQWQQPSLINIPTAIIQSATFLLHLRTFSQRGGKPYSEENNCFLQGDESHTNRAIATPSGGPIKADCAVCLCVCARGSVQITFLALKDITAVSWLTAGLADWNGALAAWTLGLVAGTGVTSALGRYGRAATSRGRVTLCQHGVLWAGRHLQCGAYNPGTSQFL